MSLHRSSRHSSPVFHLVTHVVWLVSALSLWSTIFATAVQGQAASGLVQCAPAQVHVGGGTGPYTISVVPVGGNGQIVAGAQPLQTFPALNQSGAASWLVNVPSAPNPPRELILLELDSLQVASGSSAPISSTVTTSSSAPRSTSPSSTSSATSSLDSSSDSAPPSNLPSSSATFSTTDPALTSNTPTSTTTMMMTSTSSTASTAPTTTSSSGALSLQP
ncbi:hypothetical protein JCM3774_005081 [Rhodotorula dairenensis]